MADEWDQFPDATDSGDDPWAHFPDADTKTKTTQAVATKPSTAARMFEAVKNVYGAQFEPAVQIGSSMAATPIAGLIGLGASALEAAGIAPENAGGNTVRAVEHALTYEPRTAGGKAVSGIISYPFQKLAEFADSAGGATTDATGSPALGTLVNAGIQFAPVLIGKGVGRMRAAPELAARIEPTIGEAATEGSVTVSARGASATSAAKIEPPNVTAAQDYVARSTALDWNSLSESVKQRISDIAKDPDTLSKLDPKALERQARLESLPVPITSATRGQLTRDPVQLRNEGNVSATQEGKPIRDMHVASNRALLDNLDVLKGKVSRPNGATTAEDVGLSVQDAALRAKLKLKQQEVKDLYQKAEGQGELQGPVSVESLQEILDTSPDITHLGWVDTWLKRAKIVTTETQNGEPVKIAREVTLKEMEDLRQAAVARAMDGGTEGYYAGKVIRAIDDATDGAGGEAYKAARSARRQQAMEFEDQGAVARLVDDKSRTDRAVALEDTWRKTVLGGSIDDLTKVKRSLLTGGDATTREAGRNAWRDIRAQTVQHIIDEATKSVTRFEDGSPNITPASMDKAINSIGPEKLNAIFGSGTVRQLRKIMEATRDLKTEPPPGFKGSPTFANLLAFLEKGIAKIPVVGPVAEGAVRIAAKGSELNQTGRVVSSAQRLPLEESVGEAKTSARRAYNHMALRRSFPSFVPAIDKDQR